MTRHPYVRPTTALVDAEAFRSNWRTMKQRLPKHTGILAIVKANAYGHGSVEMTKLCHEMGAVGVGVADVSEAIVLRESGYEGEILCLGAIPENASSEALRYNLIVTLHDLENLATFEHFSNGFDRPIRVHLKVDTGMHRLGIPKAEWEYAANKLPSMDYLAVEGIFTHLAESDSSDTEFTRMQIEEFEVAAPLFEKKLGKKLIRHISNSGGALGHDSTHLDWVRPGIALYGYPPKKDSDFKPVLQWKSPILQIKTIQSGDSVGYGRAFRAQKEMTIATVAAGYGDGFRIGYAPVGVGFRGHRVPIVGTICMDLMMIDVSQESNVQVGEEVFLLGPPSTGGPDARELATAEHTIPYEVLTSISARVSRQYTRMAKDDPS